MNVVQVVNKITKSFNITSIVGRFGCAAIFVQVKHGCEFALQNRTSGIANSLLRLWQGKSAANSEEYDLPVRRN